MSLNTPSSNYHEFIEENTYFYFTTGVIESQKFKFPGSDCEFNFYIITTQSVPNVDACLMIYLHKAYQANVHANILSRISILGENDRKFYTQVIRANFTGENDYCPISGGVYFLKRDQIFSTDGLLVRGKTLRIQFEVELLQNENSTSKFLIRPKVDRKIDEANPREKAFEDFQSLMETNKHSDVLFVIRKDGKKKEFRLHKNIMASRCEVFESMFKIDCEEKRKNRVEITDMNIPVFEELIRYIYTGRTGEGLEMYAEELFEAADKYQLDSLKSQAAHELASKLSIDSVSGVLLLADMHCDAQLKTDCIKFITQNVKEVMQTEAWKVAIEPRVDLMAQLYRDIANVK